MWTPIDQWVIDLFSAWRDPLIGQVMVYLSKIVDYWLWFFVVIYFVIKKKPYGYCYGFTLLGGTIFYEYILKPLFHRPRPCQLDSGINYLIACPANYSFPSGHTTMSFIAATLLFGYDRKVGIVAYLLAALIAVSRLYLGVHYFSDVVGGIVIGIAIATVGIKIMKINENNS